MGKKKQQQQSAEHRISTRTHIHKTKVCLTLLFREKPTLAPVFAKVKKFEEGFHFHKNTGKSKIALRLYFVVRGYRGSTPQQQAWCCQAPSQRTALRLSA